MSKWFLSSTGSGDLSLTLKGILGAFIPLILIAAQGMGYELTETHIEEFVSAIGVAISGVMVVVGLVRKAVKALSSDSE